MRNVQGITHSHSFEDYQLVSIVLRFDKELLLYNYYKQAVVFEVILSVVGSCI